MTLSGGSSGPTRGSSFKSGHSGPKRSRGRGRQVRFGEMNLLYDAEGYEYPVEDYGQLYIPLETEQAAAEVHEEAKSKEIKY